MILNRVMHILKNKGPLNNPSKNHVSSLHLRCDIFVDEPTSSAYVICILRSNHSAGRFQSRRKVINTRCKCEGSDNVCRYRLHVTTRSKWDYG